MVSGLLLAGFRLYRQHADAAGLWRRRIVPVHRLSWVVVDREARRRDRARLRLRCVERWQARQDRKLGEQAAVEREEVVEVERKRFEEHEPIRIEPPQTEIPKSDRVIKEKQKPLFEDLPDSPLPPLHLLDEPPADVEMLSAETLEYTSRLIEKKLPISASRSKSWPPSPAR